jgi:hypothetical protein
MNAIKWSGAHENLAGGLGTGQVEFTVRFVTVKDPTVITE